MMSKPSIYLAGGFHSNWQDKLISKYSDNFVFYNPQNNCLSNAREYTIWDLYHIDKCDILFGFMEIGNPSGFGIALEIGYARAKGKTIILVDEKSKIDPDFAKYFRMSVESSSIYFESLKEGIEYLSKYHLEK